MYGRYFLPRSILARDQLNPYLQGAQGKEVEQWQSGVDHNARLLNVDASPVWLSRPGGGQNLQRFG